MIWTDPSGLSWQIIDYRVVGDAKKRAELGSWAADGRAFVPHERIDVVLLYEFGRVAYRDTADRTLANQLLAAKPSSASAAQRSWGK